MILLMLACAVPPPMPSQVPATEPASVPASQLPIVEKDGHFELDLSEDERWAAIREVVPPQEEGVQHEPPPDAQGQWASRTHDETRVHKSPGYEATWDNGRVDWELIVPGESTTNMVLCLLTVKSPTRADLLRGAYCEPISSWRIGRSMTIGAVEHTYTREF